MAGLGKKTFTAGDVLIAGDVNNYLMDQTVMNFATVAARSSAIPVPSTGMVSYVGTTGTASIPQIETYTGADWQTPYGLTLVGSANFTSALSVTLDNVFTSAYRNYKIMYSMTNQSAANVVQFRYRNSTPSTVSSSNYNINTFGPTNWTTSTIVSAAPATATLGEIGYSAGGAMTYNADIFAPQLATATFMSGTSASIDEARVKNNLFNTTTQFAGITIFPAGGNFTGSVQIYGYRNS
jgi:hypothetical protein